VDGLYKEDIKIVAGIFNSIEIDTTVSHLMIVGALGDHHAPKDVEDLFQNLLHRSVIVPNYNGQYQSLIPSFHSWIMGNFGREMGKESC